MKYSIYFLIVGILFTSASCSKDKYSPDRYLSKDEQQRFIQESVYYSSKLPPNGSEETKFSSDFDWYYNVAAHETELLKYYHLPDGSAFFLVGRKARSIAPMREGIGGKIRYDDAGKLTEYEEVFRTWKMPEDTLVKRGAFLFDRMVQGKDLSMYYSKYQADRYIEFPDERFYFDKHARHWRDRELDSLKIN